MLIAISILLVLCLAILFALAFKHPGVGLAAAWGMLAMEGVLQQSQSFFTSRTALVNILVALIATTASYTYIRKTRMPVLSLKLYPPQLLYYATLLAFTFASLMWTTDSSFSIIQFQKTLPYILTFAFIAPICSADTEQLDIAVKTTVLLGGLILLGTILGQFGARGLLISQSNGRTAETNPLAIANYAGTVALCCLFSMYSKSDDRKLLLLHGAIAVLSAVVIFRSGSRGQLIAVFTTAAIFLPIAARKASGKAGTGALTFIAAIGLASYFLVHNSAFMSRWHVRGMQVAQRERMNMAGDALQIYTDGNIFELLAGIGTSSSWLIFGIYPHNVPVEILLEEGIIGLAIFAAVAILPLIQFRRILRLPTLPPRVRSQMCLLAALLTFNGILMLKQGTFLGSSPFFCISACVGWVYMDIQRRTASASLSPRNSRTHPRHSMHIEPAHQGR
ncbi:hypothetical protein K227x_18780 [Rubripirellula lacrimiformis]|uniref:O-Antigen ligase n=1 Tax=Rubripirellula lacrimiformis TaxID=1930273 RepID=A0A517N8M6_9BACT|nr:O-antigen ligase family protein [Rubripirellula lacrimiformis]QDT03494.1 hypothetical protein K227x_18780 [Rubripirellula lacrimiformis]